MANPVAPPSDFTTLDSILNTVYEVISGPAGHPRNWDRFRSLFAEGARLMPVVSRGGGMSRLRVLTPEEYIHRVEPIFSQEDFWERETTRTTEVFGQVAHILSSYESLRSPEAAPFERGTNSMQLFNDRSRWWIVSVMWNTTRPE